MRRISSILAGICLLLSCVHPALGQAKKSPLAFTLTSSEPTVSLWLAADSEGTTVSFSSCNSIQQQTIGQQLKRIDIAMRCDTLRVYGHVSLVAMSEQSLADMQASGTLRAMG